MKTRELIKKLFKADPVGDQEVCVGNLDINFVENVPAYYDGAYQVIERDSFGRITGGKYIKSGNKVQINTLAICDILEHDNVVISYKELLRRKYGDAIYDKIMKSSGNKHDKLLDMVVENPFYVPKYACKNGSGEHGGGCCIL